MRRGDRGGATSPTHPALHHHPEAANVVDEHHRVRIMLSGKPKQENERYLWKGSHLFIGTMPTCPPPWMVCLMMAPLGYGRVWTYMIGTRPSKHYSLKAS